MTVYLQDGTGEILQVRNLVRNFSEFSSYQVMDTNHDSQNRLKETCTKGISIFRSNLIMNDSLQMIRERQKLG